MQTLENKSELEVSRFFDLLDQYQNYALQAGKPVRRSNTELGRQLFFALEEKARAQLLGRLEIEISIFENMLQDGERITSCSRQIWRYLAKAKQTPCSDIFDKISTTDTVQIFSLENRLLFMSLNFLEHVSFTLEQIFCQPWNQATRRDSKQVQALMSVLNQIRSGEIRNTIDPKNEWHEVEELGTELLLRYKIRVKWISPLFSNQGLNGFLAIVECST